MKLHAFLTACLMFATAARADIVPGSYSPDKKFAIAKVDDDYCIIETTHHRNLGSVVPRSQDEITNISIQEVRWTKDDSKVAFVLFYGSKNSELLICERDSKGKYKPVEFDYPDPEKAPGTCKRKFPKYRSVESDDSVNELHTGHWTDNGTIPMISGEQQIVQKEGADDACYHFLVMFQVKISRDKVSVSKPEPVGVFIGDDNASALAAWQKTH